MKLHLTQIYCYPMFMAHYHNYALACFNVLSTYVHCISQWTNPLPGKNNFSRCILSEKNVFLHKWIFVTTLLLPLLWRIFYTLINTQQFKYLQVLHRITAKLKLASLEQTVVKPIGCCTTTDITHRVIYVSAFSYELNLYACIAKHGTATISCPSIHL